MTLKETNRNMTQALFKLLKANDYEDLKLGHVYEILSHMSGYKNWSTATALGVDFEKTLKGKTEQDIYDAVDQYLLWRAQKESA